MITINKCLLLALTGALGTAALQADSISLFDGKSLNGWTGDTAFWKVEDGTITGESTAANPCKKTTYLTYNKLEFSNFELTFSFRFMSEAGNSGVQYRSQWKDKDAFQIKGYQADMETGKNYSGILYDQDGRGIVAKRGEHVTISKTGEKTKKTPFTQSAQLAQESLKLKKWNSYRIVADGHTLTHEINGHKTVQVVDNQENKFSLKGLLALQLHQGPAMKVQFKDMLMLELEDTPGKAKDF